MTTVLKEEKGSKSLTWKDLDLSLYPFCAGMYILANDVILYPADLLTTRLQNDKYTKQSNIRLRPLIGSIIRKEGVLGIHHCMPMI